MISFWVGLPFFEGEIFWVPTSIGFDLVMVPTKWTFGILVVANKDWTCGFGKDSTSRHSIFEDAMIGG